MRGVSSSKRALHSFSKAKLFTTSFVSSKKHSAALHILCKESEDLNSLETAALERSGKKKEKNSFLELTLPS
jgi:hypothetical protein